MAPSGCGAPALGRCSAIQTYAAVAETVRVEAHVPPDRRALSCFVESVAHRCAMEDVASLPSGEAMGLAPVCWVAVAQDGHLCTELALESLLSSCSVAELALVAPWRGSCGDATDAWSALADGVFRADLETAAVARFALHAHARGALVLGEDARADLAALVSARPSQEELRLGYAAQTCGPSDAHPWLGRIGLSSIADISYVD